VRKCEMTRVMRDYERRDETRQRKSNEERLRPVKAMIIDLTEEILFSRCRPKRVAPMVIVAVGPLDENTRDVRIVIIGGRKART
jgi:hypothetical protein